MTCFGERKGYKDSSPSLSPLMSQRKRARLAPVSCAWYDMLVADVRAEILARVDYFSRATFALVNHREREAYHDTIYVRGEFFYEDLAEVLLSGLASRDFKRHWIHDVRLDHLRLWLLMKPEPAAHILLSQFTLAQQIACWGLIIDQLPFEDEKDKARATFYQHTAERLLRLHPTSVEDYDAARRGWVKSREHALRLPNPVHYRSPAAFLFVHALRPRYSLEEDSSGRSERQEEEEEKDDDAALVSVSWDE